MSLPDALSQPVLRARRKRPRAYLEALEFQRALAIDILNDAVKAADRASCVRAWDILEERKRILRGKPLPGMLRPDLQQKPTRKAFPSFRSMDAIDVSGPKESLALPAEGEGSPPPEGDK